MKNSRALFGTSIIVGDGSSSYEYYANDNDIISVDTNNGSPSSYAVTIYLPRPKDTVTVYVLDQKGNASVNNIIIVPPSGVLIDGNSYCTIDDDNGSIYLLSDGITWKIISSSKTNPAPPTVISTYISVGNLTALGLLDDSTLPNGCLASINNLLDVFYLDRANSLVPDGITIIETNSGTGNWIRLFSNNISWSFKTDWYIDPLSGNDESPATISQPIKTLKEWYRRVGTNQIKVDMNIYLMSDLSANDELSEIINFGSESGTLTITGELGKSNLSSGVLTYVSSCNPSLNSPWEITDSYLSGDWSSYISSINLGKRLRIINNLSEECIAWIAKDLGSKKCRISQPSSSNFTNVKNQTYNTIQSGNVYYIEQLPTIKNFNPVVNIPTERQQSPVFIVKDLAIKPDGSLNISPKSFADYPGSFAFYNCDLLLDFNGKQSFVNCRFLKCQQKHLQDETWIIGGLFFGDSLNDYDSNMKNFVIDNRFMIQGARLNCSGIRVNSIVSSIQIYDCPSPWRGGITVQSGGCGLTIKPYFNPLVSKEIFGKDNFAAGFRIYQDSSIQYDTDISGMTLTGNSGDLILGTTDSEIRSYSVLPFFEVDKRKYNGVTIVTNLTAFNTINT